MEKIPVELSNARLNVVNDIWQYCQTTTLNQAQKLFGNVWGLLADKLSTLAIKKRNLPENKKYVLKLQYWEAYYLKLAILNAAPKMAGLYEQTVLKRLVIDLDQKLA